MSIFNCEQMPKLPSDIYYILANITYHTNTGEISVYIHPDNEIFTMDEKQQISDTIFYVINFSENLERINTICQDIYQEDINSLPLTLSFNINITLKYIDVIFDNDCNTNIDKSISLTNAIKNIINTSTYIFSVILYIYISKFYTDFIPIICNMDMDNSKFNEFTPIGYIYHYHIWNSSAFLLSHFNVIDPIIVPIIEFIIENYIKIEPIESVEPDIDEQLVELTTSLKKNVTFGYNIIIEIPESNYDTDIAETNSESENNADDECDDEV